MKVLLVQSDIKWQSREENLIHIEKLLENSSPSDLIILPEMFTTGFCTSPKGAAEEADSKTLEWMQWMAEKKDAAIAGSVATHENEKYYNRFYFVKPDGAYTTYNKRHLFTFAGEDKEYTGGKERVIVEFMGFRILLQVCYDLRFPVFSRNRKDYDMIIYVANWPIPRIDAWNALLRARAIENVCYVAAVNRVGDDSYVKYNGGTVLLDYLGKDIKAAEFGKEEYIAGDVEIESLNEFRLKFPALNDADQFEITNL
ncbi:MAG TPA: amidohydrolase [Dysgonomonas sp.]|nr:amidohydrolase [Dysgonomonas sp.]